MTHSMMKSRLAAASVETFAAETETQGEGKTIIEWTRPDGSGMYSEVVSWQRIDGFNAGDIIDITTEGRRERTLTIPVQSSRKRVEITLRPEDEIVVKVGDNGWQYGVIIRGARAVDDSNNNPHVGGADNESGSGSKE